MGKQYTKEEYEILRQRVLNLRQSAVAEQGSENHTKIWTELTKLEEELQDAQIIDLNDKDADKKIMKARDEQLFAHIESTLSDDTKDMISNILSQENMNINKKR